jgi:hypothetical protein
MRIIRLFGAALFVFCINEVTWAISPAVDLATAAMSASSAESRRAALLDIFRAIRVGVYSGETGPPLIQGAERSDHDLYFYAFEVDAMASSLADVDSYDSLSDLQSALARAMPTAGFQFLDSDVFAKAIVEAFGALPTSEAGGKLAAELVREIGLRLPQPYDLYGQASPDSVQLNALQVTLILSDLYVAFSQTPPIASPSVSGLGFTVQGSPENFAPRWSRAALTPREEEASYAPCVSIQKSEIKPSELGGLAGVLAAGFTLAEPELAKKIAAKLAKAGLAGVVAKGILNEIHALVIQRSVKYSAAYVDRFHYRHTEAPEEYDASIQVYFDRDLPDIVIQCGFLTGLKWPKRGPLTGVDIIFDLGELGHHADVKDCPGTCTKTTDAKGFVSFSYTPKVESKPNVGSIVRRPGNITFRPLVLKSLGNELLAFADKLHPFRMPFTAEYHKSGIDGIVEITFIASLPETVQSFGPGATRKTSADYRMTFEFEPIELIAGGDGFEVWAANWSVDYEGGESWTDHGETTLDCGGRSVRAVGDITREISAKGKAYGGANGEAMLIVASDQVYVLWSGPDLKASVRELAYSDAVDPCVPDQQGSTPTSIGPYPWLVNPGQVLQMLGTRPFPLKTDNPIYVDSGGWRGLYLGVENSNVVIRSDLRHIPDEPQ